MAKKEQKIPTIDPTVITLLAVSEEENISTVFSRAASIKPCPIGADGACCKMILRMLVLMYTGRISDLATMKR